MAELAGLIGKREARISRGPFPWDMRGARVRPDLPCSKTLEGPTGSSPYLDWTSVVSPFGIQTEHRAGGEDAKHPPFRPDPPSCEENHSGQNRPPLDCPCVPRGRQPCPSIVGSIVILDTARSAGFFRKSEKMFACGVRSGGISPSVITRRPTRPELAEVKCRQCRVNPNPRADIGRCRGGSGFRGGGFFFFFFFWLDVFGSFF